MDSVKLISHPANTAGTISGIKMRRTMLTSFAPKSAAASASVQLTPFSRARTVIVTNGKQKTVCAKSNVVKPSGIPSTMKIIAKEMPWMISGDIIITDSDPNTTFCPMKR